MIWLILLVIGFILLTSGKAEPLAEAKQAQTTLDPLKTNDIIVSKLDEKIVPGKDGYFPDKGTGPQIAGPLAESALKVITPNTEIEMVPPPGYSGPKGGPFTWSQAGNPPNGVYVTDGIPLYK